MYALYIINLGVGPFVQTFDSRCTPMTAIGPYWTYKEAMAVLYHWTR